MSKQNNKNFKQLHLSQPLTPKHTSYFKCHWQLGANTRVCYHTVYSDWTLCGFTLNKEVLVNYDDWVTIMSSYTSRYCTRTETHPPHPQWEIKPHYDSLMNPVNLHALRNSVYHMMSECCLNRIFFLCFLKHKISCNEIEFLSACKYSAL